MMWKNKMVWENINIFSKEEAKKIENLFETNLHQFGLTVNHGSFRLSVYESTLNDTFPEVHELIVNKIKKIPKLKDYTVTRSAGLRYTKDAPSMPHHYDGDDYTILIFINDNYEGSGTVFPLLKKTAHASEFGVGNALLFSGRKIKSWHGALPLKSGVRYTINVRLNKKKNFFLMVKSFFKLLILFAIEPIINKYERRHNKEIKDTEKIIMKTIPIVFSMQGCPHCDNLKKQLKESNIDFKEIDTDAKENEVLYESFSKKVGSDFLPAVIIGKKAFLPDKSFKTIDDGVNMIKEYLQELSDRENHLD